MRQARLALLVWMIASLPLGACSAQDANSGVSAQVVHVITDASDGSHQDERLTTELAAVQLSVAQPPETLDRMHMPVISQVRYYQASDQSLAERALLALRRLHPHAPLVLMDNAANGGRVDILLSTFDMGGMPMQSGAPEAAPEPPSISDEEFRLVFDPEDLSRDPLKSAPPAARAFLAAAKQADKIADPLARCLAYPDLPGNPWPRPAAHALCEYQYAPTITVSDIQAALARGDVDGLEARFAADLRRHFISGDARSEVIDRDLDVFSRAKEAGDIAQLWRQRAPKSAFAAAAQAAFFAGQAWRARGGQTSDETSRQQFASMHQWADQAVEAAQAAVAIEPKLLPTWTILMEMGQLDSRPELLDSAYQQAMQLDPTCYSMNQVRMRALSPRWGGSYDAMESLAAAVVAQAGARPLLGLVAVLPDWDRALVAGDGHDTARMAELLKPHLKEWPSSEALAALGPPFANEVPDGRWQGVAYLLEAVRFGGCGACTKNELAFDLMGIVADPDWALIHLEREVRADPEDWTAQRMIGQARYQLGRLREAKAQLENLLAHENDSAGRRDTLELLVAVCRKAGDKAKADSYAKQLKREFPDAAP